MSMDAREDRRWELPALCALCVAALLPFLNKAYHIDDPLFLWTAQQIMQNPLDFYGFQVNWQGFDEPMWAEMKNPPGVAYYMALVGSVAGFAEWVMHLAFIPFATAVVAGTYLLARQLKGNGL